MSRPSDRETIRKVLVHGGRYLGAALAGLLTYPIVARVLDEDGLGVWALLGAAAFLLNLADLGLTTAVQRSAVKPEHERTRAIVRLTLLVLCGTLPVIGTIAYFLLLDLPDASPELEADAARAAVVAVLAGAVMATAGPFRGFALARGGVRLLANARLFASVVQVVFIIVGFLIVETLLVPAFALLAAYVMELGITLWVARRIDPALPLRPGLPRDRREIGRAFRDGAAQLVINASVATALRVDLFVLVRVAPLSVVAAYGVAGRAIDQAYTLSKQATVALLPDLGNPEARARAVRVGTGLFSSVIVAGMTALAIVGQPVLIAWVGDVAAGEIPAIVLGLLATAAIVMSVYEVASTMVMMSARTGWACALPILLGSALNLALSVSLAPTYGVWAVAGSTIVGNSVTLVLMWRGASRILGWNVARLAGGVGPAVAAGMVAGLCAWLLAPWAHQGFVTSLLSCVIVGVLGILAGAAVMRWAGLSLGRGSSVAPVPATARVSAPVRGSRPQPSTARAGSPRRSAAGAPKS